MKKSNFISGNNGFSLFEIVVVIAIIGILAAIAIQFIAWDYHGAIKAADAKKTIRELQVQTIYYMEEHGNVPTIEDLDLLYNRHGHSTLVGVYDIVSYIDTIDDNKGHGNDCDKFDEDNPGNKKPKGAGINPVQFDDYLIYTVGKVKDKKIVFAVDDHPPVLSDNTIVPIKCLKSAGN